MRGQCVSGQLWMEGGEDKGNNVTHEQKAPRESFTNGTQVFIAKRASLKCPYY